MCRFKFIALILALLALSGCWKPSSKDDPNNGKSERDATASFNIVDITGKATTPHAEDRVWRLAGQREFFFYACVVDRMVSGEVKGHKFTVEVPERGQRFSHLTTNDKGCFQWSETVDYNPLAPKSTYIEVRRRIIGEGVHVGFRDARLFLYPWADERGEKDPAVVYARTGQVSVTHLAPQEKTTDALNGKLVGQLPQLWMGDLSPIISFLDETDEPKRALKNEVQGRKELPRKELRKEEGALLEVSLLAKPFVRLERLDGSLYPYELKAGQFHVWVQLIAANTGDDRSQKLLLTPNLTPAVGYIDNDRLNVSVNTGLSRQVSRGRLEMVVKIIPIGLPMDVKPFEAVYVLGDVNSVLGPKNARIKPEVIKPGGDFNYSSYIESTVNFQELMAGQHASKFEPYIFETASVSFVGIQPGESATRRTVEYKVTVCVRDTLKGDRVRDETFILRDAQGKEIKETMPDGSLRPPKTNKDGCLIWTSSLEHQYYKPEEFFFPKFTLRHPRVAEERAITKELVLNPWDAMFRTFGFDRIEFSQKFISSVRNRTKIPSYLFVPRFSYHAIRFRYEIDQFMELEVKKQILLNLKPEVLRYSGIVGGRKVTESLRDGIYLMKVAIQKDYLDPSDRGVILSPGPNKKGEITTVMKATRPVVPKHYVTAVKKLVRVNAGEINTPVEFSIHDLRLMRIRSQFMIQLEPVDEHLLQAANVLNREDQRRLEEMEKTREMSDEERRAVIVTQREALQVVLGKLRGRLNQLKDRFMTEKDVQGEKALRLPEEIQLDPRLEAEIAEALKTNDFTTTSTAPSVDLDTLVERNSGLERRTFVGPIIFLSNAYSDDLRPTDNLDERKCQVGVADCDEFKTRELEGRKVTNNYDTSEYFGSVAHLGGKHVDDLIKAFASGKEAYKREMPLLASVANFVRLYGHKFISLGNEVASLTDLSCQAPADQCAIAPGPYQVDLNQLMTEMNSSREGWGDFDRLRDSIVEARFPRREWPKLDLLRPVARGDWASLARNGEISPALADQLCRLFVGQIAAATMAEANSQGSWLSRVQAAMRRGSYDVVLRDAYKNCLKPTLIGQPQAGFAVDQKLRVFKTGEYEFNGGKQMNLNVGANFNFNHTDSFSLSTGAGINFMEMPILGTTLNRLFNSTRAGSWLKPFALRIGMDRSANRSQSDGVSINESNYLVMQAANFKIQLREYERCTVIKLNPQLVAQAFTFMIRPGQGDAILKAIHSGLFVCTGAHETVPLQVYESYFYFTQHFTEGDMLDQADLYNHPWLLALRGVRDFDTFVRLIRAQEFHLTNVFTKVVDKPAWALDHMVDIYRQVQPTFPGIYTVLRADEPLKELTVDPREGQAIRK